MYISKQIGLKRNILWEDKNVELSYIVLRFSYENSLNYCDIFRTHLKFEKFREVSI